MVNLRRCGVAAVKYIAACKILVFLGFQSHETELLGHTVLGHHGSGHFGRLLDIIGGSRGHGLKYNLLRRPARHQLHQPCLQLLLGIEVLLLLRHIHNIAQSPHGSGNNGNLLHRFGMLLQRAYKGMAHFVVGHDPALFLAHNAVLLLLAHQHYLHRLEQVLLGHGIASVLNSINSSLIHHIGQVGSHGSRGGQGDIFKVHGLI